MRHMSQLIRFILVGAFNTILGYGIIFFFMYIVNLSPEFSNAIGYMTTLIVSYSLHRRYTFRIKQKKNIMFFYFLIVFMISYCANLIILVILVRAMGVHAGISQFVAGAVYVCTSYLLNKHYAFRPSETNQ